MAYRVLNGTKQVGRTTKSLDAAEHIVQTKFGKSISSTGKSAIHIVDDEGSIIRVFYVD